MFAGAHDHPGARRDLQGPPQLLDERFRRREMLDHVEQQDVVVVRGIHRRNTVVEIVKHERVELHARAEWILVDASDAAVPLTAQHGADVSAGTAQIEHARARGHDFERRRMRARVIELRLVLRVASCGCAVEAAVVEQAELLRPRHQHRLRHVPRVLEAVHTADFVAVVGRDRQLGDPTDPPTGTG